MHGILHQHVVFFFCQYNANRWIISSGVFFAFNIAQIHVHLANTFVAGFFFFEVYQYKALQNTMVKHQIDIMVSIAQGDTVLPSNKGKTFAQFQ